MKFLLNSSVICFVIYFYMLLYLFNYTYFFLKGELTGMVFCSMSYVTTLPLSLAPTKVPFLRALGFQQPTPWITLPLAEPIQSGQGRARWRIHRESWCRWGGGKTSKVKAVPCLECESHEGPPESSGPGTGKLSMKGLRVNTLGFAGCVWLCHNPSPGIEIPEHA